MKINLYEKCIEKIDATIELKIIQNKNNLSSELVEILNKIDFFRDSYNTYFDYQNKIFYISCLNLISEDIKIAFFKTINFFKNKKNRNY